MTDLNQNMSNEQLLLVLEDRRRRRTRWILAGMIVLLVLLLGGLLALTLQAFQPMGLPAAGSLPGGMTWIRSIYQWGPSQAQQFAAPVDAAVAPDGTIWTMDASKSRLVGLAPDGKFRRQIAPGKGQAEGQFEQIEGIAVDPNGTIYVADYQKRALIEYTSSGQFVRETFVPAPLSVAVSADRVAVGTVQGVALFDKNGQFIGTWGTRGKGPEQFDGVHGLVWSADGSTLFVSDTRNARVKAYSKDGKLLWISGTLNAESRTGKPTGSEPVTQTGSAGSGTRAASPDNVALQLPAAMAVDGQGRLVVVDPFEFQMVVLNPEAKGAQVARYGDYGETDGLFAYPTGLSYDPARDYFVVADTTNNRLQEVRLPGSAGSQAVAIQNILDQPLWICAIPLVLLVIAVIIAVTGRRRRNTAEEGLGEGEVQDDVSVGAQE